MSDQGATSDDRVLALGNAAGDDRLPAWLVPSLEVNEGRDPLGFQTTTTDRLMPLLLPGILELSRRARYFSFHAFLLAEYKERRMPPENKSLSSFIKRREWEFGLAVQRCPRHCGSSPVGARKLGSVALGPGPFRRGESVENPFGGYGLYYRSPMVDLGIVARAGTLLGDKPIPIDVLYDTKRANRLATAFKSAVEGTRYYQRAMWTTDELDADVIDEYAEVACLCRLRERPAERAAVHDALFGEDDRLEAAGAPAAATTEALAPLTSSPEDVLQRRRSVAHYLTLLQRKPEIVPSESAYRDALWSAPTSGNEGHELVAGQWAALIAKDVWQEAICSIWSEFCRVGLARTRELGRGLTWKETQQMSSGLVAGPPHLSATTPTGHLVRDVAEIAFPLPAGGHKTVNIVSAEVEDLRQLTVALDTAASGLVVVLELARRIAGRSGMGWQAASHVESGWQPSVAAVVSGLRSHLVAEPTVGDTLWWLTSRFIVPIHERIAYSKLPEFTFRFRWDEGLLHFYDLGIGRFTLAGIRHGTLALITRDIGLWDEGPLPERSPFLTAEGVSFIEATFA